MKNIIEFDIVIVGGGIMGVAALYHLSKIKNLRIALFEKTRIGAGSTNKSGGFVRCFHNSEKEIEWSIKTLKFLREHKLETNFNEIGSLYIPDMIDDEQLRVIFNKIRNENEAIELIDYKDIIQSFNFIPNKHLQNFIYEPNAGFADPLKTCLFYAELSKNNGAMIFEFSEIDNISVCNDKISLEVGNVNIITQVLHLSVGAWSSTLLKKFGLKSDTFVKGIQVNKLINLENTFPTCCLIDEKNDIYMRPFGFNQHLVGSSTNLYDINIENNNCLKLNESQLLDTLIKAKSSIGKSFDSSNSLGGRFGFDGYSSDYKGKIYRNPVCERIIVSEGWSGGGFKFSHGAGEYCRDIILESLETVDI